MFRKFGGTFVAFQQISAHMYQQKHIDFYTEICYNQSYNQNKERQTLKIIYKS